MRGVTLFVISLLFVVISSCASKRNKYAETNKIHTKHVEEVAESIKKPLPPQMPSPQVSIADIKGKRQDLDWVGTVNFDMRRPSYVIIHHTAQESMEETIRTFTLERTQVSSHYVISRDGKTVQMLNDYLRSWHAGVASRVKLTDMMSITIGIEMDDNGSESVSNVQIDSLLRLLDTLKTNYRISTENFIGHSDIAPTQKQDRSALFPWKLLGE